jgi:hypothetical protein
MSSGATPITGTPSRALPPGPLTHGFVSDWLTLVRLALFADSRSHRMHALAITVHAIHPGYPGDAAPVGAFPLHLQVVSTDVHLDPRPASWAISFHRTSARGLTSGLDHRWTDGSGLCAERRVGRSTPMKLRKESGTSMFSYDLGSPPLCPLGFRRRRSMPVVRQHAWMRDIWKAMMSAKNKE